MSASAAGTRSRRGTLPGSRLRGRPHPAGLVAGTAFAMLAMTPSLVPRDWLFQGVVSGISAAAGYGIGVVLAWLVRRTSTWRRLVDAGGRRVPPGAATAAWALLLVAAPAALTAMLVASAGWQRQIAALMGMDQTTTSGWLRAGPTLVGVAAVVLLAARSLALLASVVGAGLHRWVRLPRLLAAGLGVVLAATVVVVVVNDVLLRRVLSVADSAFADQNQQTPEGVEQPDSPLRAGSPGSLVPWDTLGKQGKSFVAGGPSRERLAVASGRPPLDPIRVYVGLASAPDPSARAELAVAELERTGAFERSVLAVVTTTGTGWINAAAVDSLELMHGGDTAIVASQYSYLASWLSFVVDRTRAEQEGRLLIDAVADRVQALPEPARPRLLVFGESQGSYGAEHAFDSLADLRARTDGVLWVGPPHANPIWSSLVERRDPGTPQVRPVYASGLVVRFAGDAADLDVPPTPWLEPRVLYLQHPSDPVVWWSPRLLLRRPDWLVEPRGSDVSPAMSWYPVVTFWQVSADLAHSKDVPDGHGHNYDALLLDGWAAVAAPDGWTDADTERVREVLAG